MSHGLYPKDLCVITVILTAVIHMAALMDGSSPCDRTSQLVGYICPVGHHNKSVSSNYSLFCIFKCSFLFHQFT